jgi:hypothetical protein
MPAAAAKAPATKLKPAPRRAAKKFAKKEILALWEEAAEADRTLTPKPIPAGFRGSRLPLYSIRISGSLSEIKATLGKLGTLRRFEGGKTRLNITLGELTEKGGDTVIAGSYVCYLQICERA